MTRRPWLLNAIKLGGTATLGRSSCRLRAAGGSSAASRAAENRAAPAGASGLANRRCRPRRLHPLEDLVMLAIHPQARVDNLGGFVALVDVEADAADRRLGFHHRLHVLVQ